MPYTISRRSNNGGRERKRYPEWMLGAEMKGINNPDQISGSLRHSLSSAVFPSFQTFPSTGARGSGKQCCPVQPAPSKAPIFSSVQCSPFLGTNKQ